MLAITSARTLLMIKPIEPPLINPKPICIPLDDRLLITCEPDVCLKAFILTHHDWSVMLKPIINNENTSNTSTHAFGVLIRSIKYAGAIRQDSEKTKVIEMVEKQEAKKRSSASVLSFGSMIAWL